MSEADCQIVQWQRGEGESKLDFATRVLHQLMEEPSIHSEDYQKIMVNAGVSVPTYRRARAKCGMFEPRDALERTKQALRDLLSEGPMSVADARAELKKRLGVSDSTIRRAREDLGVRTRRLFDSYTQSWVNCWELPPSNNGSR